MAAAFQNQNQFLGSRISLVSKSEIRYEGILYALDLCEATISLAKVRSFGTEDRPTERPVPPKDDVYEYIIFRGADIKVIDVVEPPKHAGNSGMTGVPADPAIVDFSHSNGNGHHGHHYEGGRMRGGGPNNSVLDNLFKGRAGPPMYNNGGQSPHNGGMRRRSGGYPNEGQNGRGNMNRNMGGGGGPGGRPNFGPGPGGRNNFGGQVHPNMWHFRQGGYMPRDNGGQFQQRGRTTTPNRGGNFGQPRRGGNGGGRQQGNGNGGNGGNRTPFRNRGMNQAAFPPKVSFDGDFDFEKANEELISTLAKAKLEDENTENKSEDDAQTGKDEQETKETRTFYKKDNFFDNISCESLERSKGNVPRVDWKAERKLNAETFGLILNPNSNGNNGMRINNRRGGGQRMPRGMPNMNRNGPGGNNWVMMSPNNYYRGGNMSRRTRQQQ